MSAVVGARRLTGWSREVKTVMTPAESLASQIRNPEAEHSDRELQTLVRRAVARLGKTAGEMFVLRYYEGHDNQEIARLMRQLAGDDGA